MIERVPKEMLEQQNIKRQVVKRGPFKIVMSAHFLWRLKTRLNNFITVDEVADKVYDFISATPNKTTYTITYRSCTIYVRKLKKRNWYIVCTIVPHTEKRERFRSLKRWLQWA